MTVSVTLDVKWCSIKLQCGAAHKVRDHLREIKMWHVRCHTCGRDNMEIEESNFDLLVCYAFIGQCYF